MGKLVVARLGNVEFSVPEGTFTELERSTRWAVDVPDPIDGLGKPFARRRSYDEITIRGIVFPGVSGTLSSVQRLRDLADEGRSHVLVDGEGNVFGAWAVSAVNERRGPFLSAGIPRRMEWDMQLVSDPDDVAVPL